LAGGLGSIIAAGIAPAAGLAAAASPKALIDDVATRTFRYFWRTTDARTGLAPDRYPSPAPASVAAVGFALTAYPAGVERGLITRAEARRRVKATLLFLHDAPQGPAARGKAGYKGFYYHFLDMATGARAGDSELSTVDTALLLCGVLFCAGYFDAAHPDERTIRALAEAIYARVDWRWAQPRPPSIVLGWTPENGFLPYDWRGYCEAMLVYLLALGAPTHAVGRDAWDVWLSGYKHSWGVYYGEEHLGFASLFGHFYAQTWVDFRGIQDSFMRAHDLDYFENTRRAIRAQRNYAIANPLRWRHYGADLWGISACDGPTHAELTYDGQKRLFRRYWARGAAGPWAFDDGTLTPAATLAALAFTPDLAMPAIEAQHRRYGADIYGAYGFVDAFNPSFDFEVPLQAGRRVAGVGWVDCDYIGIDQGLIMAMLENHRSELIWRVMRGNAHLRRGLRRAGFEGGWLGRTA
jgi:hypothetical protein